MTKISMENIQSIENFTLRQEAIKWFSGGEDEIFYGEAVYIEPLKKEINILLLPTQHIALIDTDELVSRLKATSLEEAVAAFIRDRGTHNG